MLSRIDFLKNNNQVGTVDIILSNALGCKGQTVVSSIYWEFIGGSQHCQKTGQQHWK